MKNLITKFFFIFLITLIGNQTFAQTISLVSATATTNQTLCVNNPITEIKYLSTGGVTDVTVSGLPDGVSGTFSLGFYSITGTPTSWGTYTYTITTVGGTNAAVSETGTITVDSPASASQGWNSTLCLNSTANISDIAVSNGTYLWTHNGLGSLSGNTTMRPTYTPVQGDVGKTVTLTLLVTSNNSCPTSTATSTFTYDVKGIPSFNGNLYTYVGSTVQMIGSPGKHQYYPWTSSDASIATIDNTGLVTGVALGSTSISYYDTNYCSVSKMLDVVTLVTPSISGNLTICSGSTSQLTGTETAMAIKPWVSSDTLIASVSSTGIVTGLSTGTAAITYMNSTGGSSSVNVVIKATPSVSVNAQTICNGASATLSAIPSTTGGTYLWGGNETSQNVLVSPTTTSNYTVIYTLNGCSSNQSLATVTVNPLPTVNAGADITVCSGSSVTLSGSGAQIYSWSNSVSNGVSFVPTVGSTTYTLTGTSNGCVATDNVIVTVNASPVLVINNPVAVCSPNTIDITSPAVTAGSIGGGTMTYWTDANCTTSLGSPSAIINAGPIYIKSTLGACSDVKQVTVTINSQPSISGNLSTYATSTTQLTGSATAAVNTPWLSSNTGIATVSNTGLVTGIASGTSTITYTNNNGCSNTALVTVGALNTITLSSAVGTDNQTVCSTSSITNITYTTSGATGASFSGLPLGTSGLWTSNTITISGTPTISGVYNYIITLTGGNGTVTKLGTIIVNAASSISSQATTTQTVCNGNAFSPLTVSASGSGISYQWYSNSNNINSGGAIINGAISATYTPNSSVDGTQYYYCKITGSCGNLTSAISGAMIVNAGPTVNAGAGTTICSVSNFTAAATITSATPTWSTTGSGTFVNPSIEDATYIPSANDKLSGNVILTLTATGNLAGCTSQIVSSTVTIAINSIDAPTSSAGASASICSGSNFTAAATTTKGSNFWSTSGTGTFANQTIEDAVYTPSSADILSGSVSLTLTCIGTLNACQSQSTNSSVLITFLSTPSVTGSSSVTIGSTSQLASVATAAINSPWTSSNTGIATVSNTGLVTGISVGTSIITFTNNTGCSNTTTVTVNALNSITLSSTAGTDNQTVCVNSPITTITYSTTGATGATFSGLPAGIGGSWIGNTVTITGTSSATGTFNYLVTLTGGNGTITQNGTILINAVNTINLSSTSGTDNQTVCVNVSLTDIKYATTGATGANFSGLPNGVSGNFNNNQITLSGTPTVSGTFNYSITLSGGCGVTSIPGTITVIPSNTITLTSAVGTNNQTICESNAITNITYNTTGATGANFTALPNGVTGNWNSNVITISGTPLNSSTFTISLIGGCGNITNSGMINIDAKPTAVAGASQTICGGANATITGAAASNGTILWSHNGLGSIANGTTLTPIYTSTIGEIGNTVILTMTVTSINSCTSNSATATATVTIQNCAAPVLSITNPSAVCSPTTVDLTSSLITMGSTNVGNLTYWSDALATTSIGTPAAISASGTYYIKSTNGNGSDIKAVIVTINQTPILTITNPAAICLPLMVDITAPSVTSGSTGGGTLSYWNNLLSTSSLTNPSSVSNSGTYYIKSTLGSCSDVKPVTVEINDCACPINLVITPPAAVCSPNTVDLTTSSITVGSSGGGTLSYWTDPSTTTLLPNPSSIQTSGTYYIKSIVGNCTDLKPVTVTINTTPSLTITNPAAVCSPNTVDITASSITAGTTGSGTLSYWSDVAATSSLINPTSISVSGTYFIKSTLGNCSDVKAVVATINPIPTIANAGADQILCSTTTTLGAQQVFSGTGIWSLISGNGTIVSPSSETSSVTGLGMGQNVLRWTVNSSCGSSFDDVVITSEVSPTIALAGADQSICYSQTTLQGNQPLIGTGVWTLISGNGQIISNSNLATTSISNLGIGNNTFVWTISNSCGSTSSSVNIVLNDIPVLTITNPSPVTSPTTVDITAPSITSGSTGNGILTYWINPDASVPLTNPTAISMSGTYYIKSVLGNCSDTSFVTVTINKVSSPTTQLNAYVIPKGATQNGYCDGSAEVVVTSGTAPYTFLFSDNSTDIKAAGLCSGLKSVRVADANKDTLYINFIISSPGNLTTTKTLVDSTIIDSVFNAVVTNCVLNYSKIDSAKIINYTLLSNDSIKINWKVYSANTNTVISSVYAMNVISNAGVYSFVLQIYCPNKVSGNFLTAYDQVYLSTEDVSSAGIKSLQLNEYSVYPNPFSEKIIIKSLLGEVRTVVLSDITGKVLISKILTSEEEIIETSELSKGNYLLTIGSDNDIETFKFIK